MYEQSIPALAYVFIGITSLVVTYSQIVGKDIEPTDGSIVQEEEEPTEELVEEPEITDDSQPSNPLTNIGNSIMNTLTPTAPPAPTESEDTIPVAQAIPLVSDPQKMGGKKRKTKNNKRNKNRKNKTKIHKKGGRKMK
jgi:hypothetical protein